VNISDFLGWSGLILGVVGLVATAVQTARLQRTNQRRQETMRHVIDRSNYLHTDSPIVYDLLLRNPDPHLARQLWLSHQASSDLYFLAVDEFLFNERRFTYDDLMAIADSPLVGGRWQFRYWVSKVAHRPENRKKGRPQLPEEFFNTTMDTYRKLRESDNDPDTSSK
jgi:hypothetical protein